VRQPVAKPSLRGCREALQKMNTMMPEKAEEFRKMRGAFQNQLLLLNLTSRVYESIIEIRKEEIEIYNYAAEFFGACERALWGQLVLIIFKLAIDKNKNTRALVHKYLDFVENHKQIFPDGDILSKGLTEMLAEYRERLLAVKPALDSIMKRRHSYYAHLNDEFLFDVRKMNEKFRLN
jgi:hypothetical protein